MPGTTTSIPARFNGPPGSANGGYACGTLGVLIGDTAEVTLRKPPRLDATMVVRRGNRGLSLWDGETVIADARGAELDIELPPLPSAEQIQAAEVRFHERRRSYGFTTCFVCGPDRDHGDGLRIFPAPIEDQQLVAAFWSPTLNLANDEGVVDPRVVWAALDCPTFFGGALLGQERQSVLGRMTAKLVKPVFADQTYTVTGWPVDLNGRITIGASAIHDADGELCAISRGTWVTVA